MPPLRLAVDARVIAEDTRGIGRYARAVMRRLILCDDVELTLLAAGPFPGRSAAAYTMALGSDRFVVRSRVGRNLDAIWHPANGTFFTSKLPSIATIHDAVPFRYPNPDSKRRRHAQLPFLRSARTATRVIAVSRFGRSEVHSLLAIPLQSIEVIEHGVDSTFAPGDARPLPAPLHGRPFLLFVGDPLGEPRKNFALLYDAYRRAWPEGDGPSLAIAGPRAPALPGVVHAGNLADDLVAGSNDSLRACYRGAVALVLASYHETFGMPMLEAMACGTPVVASSASALPEIAGDAALFAPADDAQAWASALRRIIADALLRENLRSAGLRRARHFSWDESARRHLLLFREVAQR
ncbi:MAG: glycosyltransferase family 4 protein [Candidatus Eremiobacteraeota bacterium]|nr:glycosyltransferase family 4 protein [Candidatus Eremiobacteraeota bacterium]